MSANISELMYGNLWHRSWPSLSMGMVMVYSISSWISCYLWLSMLSIGRVLLVQELGVLILEFSDDLFIEQESGDAEILFLEVFVEI